MPPQGNRVEPDPTVTFRILGPLHVGDAHESIRVGGLRQQRLLALLLLHANLPVAVPTLVDRLWETAPPSARQQIHNAVRSLRQTQITRLRGVRLVTGGQSYRLSVPERSIDVLVFQEHTTASAEALSSRRIDDAIVHLTAGLRVWRGPALSGFDGLHFGNAAVALNEQRHYAVERLMALRIGRGEASSVIGELAMFVAENPLRDLFRALLMTALSRVGRQAEALTVYDDGRRTMSERFGLDPGPILRDVRDRILRDEDGLELVGNHLLN